MGSSKDMAEPNFRNMNEFMRARLRGWLTADDMEFMGEKRAVESGISSALRVYVHEGSVMYHVSDVGFQSDGFAEPPIEPDLLQAGAPSSVWTPFDNDSWQQFETGRNVLCIPLVPWSQIRDVRRAITSPIEKEIVDEFDGSLARKLNELVFRDENIKEQCSNHTGPLSLNDSLLSIPSNVTGYAVMNERTAHVLMKQSHDFKRVPFSGWADYTLGESPQVSRPLVKGLVTIKKDLFPDDWIYFIPEGAVRRDEALIPTVYTERRGCRFMWYAQAVYRIVLDKEKAKGVRLIRFGCISENQGATLNSDNTIFPPKQTKGE